MVLFITRNVFAEKPLSPLRCVVISRFSPALAIWSLAGVWRETSGKSTRVRSRCADQQVSVWRGPWGSWRRLQEERKVMYLLTAFFGANVISNKELISSSHSKIWLSFVFLMTFMKNNNKKHNKFKTSANDCPRDLILLEICHANDLLLTEKQ